MKPRLRFWDILRPEVNAVLLSTFDPFVEFDRLARRTFGAGHWTAMRSAMPMDVIRGKDDVQLRFDLPGVDRESIDVTVDRGVLTVSAQRTAETGEDEKLITRERVTGSFTRRLSLGDTVDTDKIDADFADGVLTVRLPLVAAAQPRKVEIHASSKKEITA
jgi:HSP20 family protein